MSVRVVCYAGARGDETPRRVFLGGRWRELRVEGQWCEEGAAGEGRRRGFRVRLVGGERGVLVQDQALDRWVWEDERSDGDRRRAGRPRRPGAGGR